jgi:hypothetical protein
MSIKHTKSEKSQKADELEKRLDDRPEKNKKKPALRVRVEPTLTVFGTQHDDVVPPWRRSGSS